MMIQNVDKLKKNSGAQSITSSGCEVRVCIRRSICNYVRVDGGISIVLFFKALVNIIIIFIQNPCLHKFD